MSGETTIAYFGQKTVEAAIKDYLEARGATPVARDELITISRYMEDEFFEIVSDFVMRRG